MNSENECGSIANFDKCAVVLLDVAGTTTSIAFVKETLFNFAIESIEGFLKQRWTDNDVKNSIKLLQDGDKEIDVAAAVDLFKKLTKDDSNNEGLKVLQGELYKEGYEKETLKAHVFPDVQKAFTSWSKDHKVAIYSTGSIESQKQLFKYTVDGDLSTHISNYFDQSVGVKTKSESYIKIAEELKVKTEEILFISDNTDELAAAKEAGIPSVLVKRQGNAEISGDLSKEFTTISSFAEISLDVGIKRKFEDAVDSHEEPPTKISKIEANGVAKDVTEDRKSGNINKPCEEQKEEKSCVKADTPMEVDEPMEIDEPEVETKTEKAVKEVDNEIKEENKISVKNDSTTVENGVTTETENDSKLTGDNDKVVTENGANVELETDSKQLVKTDSSISTEKDTKITADEIKLSTENIKATETKVTEEKKDKIEKENTNAAAKKKNVITKAVEEVSKASKNEVCESMEVDNSAKPLTENTDAKTEDPVVDKTAVEKPVEEAKEVDKDKAHTTELAAKKTENKTDVPESKNELVVESIPEKKNDVEVLEVEVTQKETDKIVEVVTKPKEKVEDKEQNGKIDNESVVTQDVTEIGKDNQTIEELPKNDIDKISETTKIAKNTQDSKEMEAITVTECVKKGSAVDKPQEALPKTENSELQTVVKPVENKSVDDKQCENGPTSHVAKEENLKPETTSEKIINENKIDKTKDDLTKKSAVNDSVLIEQKTSDNSTKVENIGNGSCDVSETAELNKNGDVTNGQKSGEEKIDETESEEVDIKIKKIETNVGSSTVSVEV